MHNIKPRFVVPILLGVLLSACGAESGGSESLVSIHQDLSSISAAQTDTAVLGQAYHTEHQKVMNLNCVEGASELRGNSVSQLSYEQDMNFNDVLNTLAGGLSVGITLPVVSAEASANVATKHASTELSETHHLVWVGTAKKEVFTAGAVHLSTLGTFYSEQRPDLLEERCGNEFITEVHRGASFFGTMKIEFFNSEDRLEIGGKIKVNVLDGLVQADGSLQFVDSNKKKRTKLSVQVEQRGGRPERLLTIIPDNVMYCTLDDPSPCLAVFGNLITYARNDFATQLQDVTQYNVLKYVTQSYADSGLEALLPSAGYEIISQAVHQKISSTEGFLRQALADEDRAGTLMTTGAAFMTSAQRTKVQAVGQKASANVIVYADISRYCYQNLNTECLTYAADREGSLQAYARSDLDVKPPIPGDLTENGCVDTADSDLFLTYYGLTVTPDQPAAAADFNHDGVVNDMDYLVIEDHWGQGC